MGDIEGGGLTSYRIIFNSGACPPRNVRAAKVTTDPDMPGMIAFKGSDDKTICWVNRDLVLFVDERAMRLADDDDGPALGWSARNGMARVASAGR